MNNALETQIEHVVVEDPSVTIARLRSELIVAHERARVAEQQLHRVYVAVRAFKQRQIAARQRTNGRANQAPAQDDQSYGWPKIDPTLDERFEEYIESDFEPDRSRSWILGS